MIADRISDPFSRKQEIHWIWCEHALTVGYRSSFDGDRTDHCRATRMHLEDALAVYKPHSEPDASEEAVMRRLNRYFEGDCRQPAHGTGLVPAIRVLGPKPDERTDTRFGLMVRRLADPEKCNVGVNPATGNYSLRD